MGFHRLIFLCMMALASPARAIDLPLFRLVDAFGHRLTHLNFDFGQALAENPNLLSQPLRMQLAGFYVFGRLQGFVDHCSIGGTAIPDGDLLFEGQSELPLERAFDLFKVTLRLRNPQGLVGAIHCDQIVIRLLGQNLATATTQGEVVEAPVWQDEGGRILASLVFSFSGMVATVSGAEELTSRNNKARLRHALIYPANVAVLRPRSCRIGATPIADRSVRIRVGGRVFDEDGLALVSNDQALTYSLAFQGQPASAIGAVTCNQAGSLSYTY